MLQQWMRSRAMTVCLTAAAATVACGGSGDEGSGGGGEGGTNPPPAGAAPAAPTGLAVAYGAKAYVLSWQPQGNATSYDVVEDPDGDGPQGEVRVASVSDAAATLQLPSLLNRLNAVYRVRACNASGCGAYSAPLTPDVAQAIGYIKASNTEDGDAFGASVALSADGQTLAVGALYEASLSAGVNSDQNDNSLRNSGAVYVFQRSAAGWHQQAYVKPSNPLSFDILTMPPDGMGFGTSLSLSADGNVLAVGAPRQRRAGKDRDGNVVTDTASTTDGGVYVFARQGNDWAEQAHLRASKTVTGEWGLFGEAVALSADGKTLAVCAPGAYLAADGPGEVEGVALIYGFAGTWSEQHRLTSPVKAFKTTFCSGVMALSGDGKTLVTTGWGYPDPALAGGSENWVSVFVRPAGEWVQQAQLPWTDRLGMTSAALSTDGNTLALGVIRGQTATSNAAAYLLVRKDGVWRDHAYLESSNKLGPDPFPAVETKVALSGDGETLAMVGSSDASNARGLDGDQANTGASRAGAGYLFKRGDADQWTQTRYIKASNTDAGDAFGYQGIALSADGQTLAIGAPAEASRSTGVQGDQADNSAAWAGAVYVY